MDSEKKRIESFKDLVVWQKSMELAREVYKLTAQFPKEEVYGLISQMRRCAVSIPSNIAEGSRRGTKKDYAQFLRIAIGSTSELETQVLLSRDLYASIGYEKINNLLDEVHRMLIVLIKRLQQ